MVEEDGQRLHPTDGELRQFFFSMYLPAVGAAGFGSVVEPS